MMKLSQHERWKRVLHPLHKFSIQRLFRHSQLLKSSKSRNLKKNRKIMKFRKWSNSNWSWLGKKLVKWGKKLFIWNWRFFAWHSKRKYHCQIPDVIEEDLQMFEAQFFSKIPNPYTKVLYMTSQIGRFLRIAEFV